MSWAMMPGPGVMTYASPATPAVWDATKTPSNNTRTSDTVMTCNTTSASYSTSGCTVGKSTGKWIFTMEANTSDAFIGIAAQQPGSSSPWINSYHLGNPNIGECVGLETYNGEIWYNSQYAATSGTVAATSQVPANTLVTVAVDLTSATQTVKFFLGNTLLTSLNIPSGMNGFTWYPSCSLLFSGDTMTLNAGQSMITVPTPIAGSGYNPYWE